MARRARRELAVYVCVCTQAPLALAPSPNSKKNESGSPSGSLLLHRSKVTESGDWPCGGSGLVVRTAKGGRLLALGCRVVVVVVVALVAAGAVVVVVAPPPRVGGGGSSPPLTANAVVAAAVPAAAIPMTAPAPMPPLATNPAGREGNTATVALFTNGAAGRSFLHSWAELTTIGLYSAVRPELNRRSWAST
jgi:hypothetical protein